MIEDKRMYFIRNMEIFKGNKEGYTYKKFDFFSDSHIIGEFAYGPYKLTALDVLEGKWTPITNLSFVNIEKDYPDHPTLADPRWHRNDTKGYYHGGGAGDEILNLCSLFLRRRLIPQQKNVSYYIKEFLLSEVGVEGWIDEALIKGKSNLNELYEWFELLEKLDEKYHLKFIFATKMYQNAINRIEESPDISYLNLVSAIEVLSEDVDIEISIEDITADDKKLEKFLNSIQDSECQNRIKDEFLRKFKKDHYISRQFIEFIKMYLPSGFWEKNENGNITDDMSLEIIARELEGQINEIEFEDRIIPNGNEDVKWLGILKRIYNQRSRTLHAGEPFQPHIFNLIPISSTIEIPRWFYGYISGDRRWYEKDFIPYPHFFERLVNEVLKSYLKKNSKI